MSMSKILVVGIDPGLRGGLATLDQDGLHRVIPMPVADREVYVGGLIEYLCGWSEPPIVYIEKVHSMPHQGVSSTFRFGTIYGTILGAVQAAHCAVKLVSPQTWKKEILKDTDRSKEAAIAYVLRAYPGIQLLETENSRKPHDGMADAICIAEYGLRQELQGENEWTRDIRK